MSCFLKKSKNMCAMMLAVALLLSLSTVAFATNNTAETDEEISAVLQKINAEYGTNIHIMSEEELAQYGLTDTDSPVTSTYENVDLEETLRYICEVQIPQFDQNTQEANAIIAKLASDDGVEEKINLAAVKGTVIAEKDIDYATAGAEAYISKDAHGNTIWGKIVHGMCRTNQYQETSFMANHPSVTHKDNNRTLYWTGEGDYFSYINGKHYYLRSGTQYASMSISSYA